MTLPSLTPHGTASCLQKGSGVQLEHASILQVLFVFGSPITAVDPSWGASKGNSVPCAARILF